MARTALFSRKQSGGVFTIDDIAEHPGDIYFVDAGSGNSANSGENPDKPLATWDQAVNKCTANNGDVIYLLPGHAENVITATGVNFDAAGIKTIVLGWGADIPTITFTAAAGSVTIAAASIYIKNVKLVANFATGVTAGITIAAAGDQCTLEDVVMRDTTNAKEFLVHVKVATTVDGLTIINPDFVCLSGGSMTNSILFAGSSTYFTLLGGIIFADATDSVVDHLVAAGVDVRIDGLTVYNEDTVTAGYVFDFHASSTGIVTNCRGAYNKVDAAMTKGAAMWWVENYFSNTIAESGLLEPASSHAIP